MKKVFLVVMSLMCLFLWGCGGKDAANAGGEKKVQVVASFFPMAEFAKNVGGQHVDVTTLIADGVEPHDWEPTAKDLSKIKDADVFVYNGIVEPWAPKAAESLDPKKVEVVEAGKALIEAAGKNDPHVWVSPKEAAGEVKVITEALIKKDPAHKADYEKNSKAYLDKLAQLDKELKEVASTAKRKEFVTTHAAFNYLAHDYGLVQVAAMGISPDAEPAPADLTRLVNLVKDKKIKYVFFEELVSPKVSETIAEAAGAKTMVLSPLEGLSTEQRKAGEDYISVMKQNIANLKKALNE